MRRTRGTHPVSTREAAKVRYTEVKIPEAKGR